MLQFQVETSGGIQYILYSGTVIGRGIARNLLEGKVGYRIRLVIGSHSSTSNDTNIGKGDVISRGIHIYSGQRPYHHLVPRLLLDLADNGLSRCFAPLDIPAWKIPKIDIAAMAEQDALLFIQDDSKRSYFQEAPQRPYDTLEDFLSTFEQF